MVNVHSGKEHIHQGNLYKCRPWLTSGMASADACVDMQVASHVPV